MLTRLFRVLTTALLFLSLSLPFAVGQDKLPTIERGVKKEAATSDEEEASSGPSYAFPYFVLMIYSMLVLTIVFMPSRKA